MIRKRIAFAVLTLSTLMGLIGAAPAEARGRGCDSGYGGGYGRRSSYYDDGWSPRRRYASYGYGGYDRGSCRPRYRGRSVRYVTRYDYAPVYRPRRSYVRSYRRSRVVRHVSYRPAYVSRHRCGCGERFASAHWLSYHRTHVHDEL